MAEIEHKSFFEHASQRAKHLVFELSGPVMRAGALIAPGYSAEEAVRAALANEQAQVVMQNAVDTALGVRVAYAQAANCVVSVRPEGVAGESVVFTSVTNPSQNRTLRIGETGNLPPVTADTSVAGRAAATFNVRHLENTDSVDKAYMCNTGLNNPNRQPMQRERVLVPPAIPRPPQVEVRPPAPVIIDNGNDNETRVVPPPAPDSTWDKLRRGILNASPVDLRIYDFNDFLTAVAVVGGGLWLASLAYGLRGEVRGTTGSAFSAVNPNNLVRSRRRNQNVNDVARRERDVTQREQALQATQQAQTLAALESSIQAQQNTINTRRQAREASIENIELQAAQARLQEALQKLAEPEPQGRFGRLLAGALGTSLADRQRAVDRARAAVVAANNALNASAEQQSLAAAENALTQLRQQVNQTQQSLQGTTEYQNFIAAQQQLAQAQQRAQQA